MKKKKDALTLMLTEAQYNDPMMQDIIQNADSVEIISEEKLEGLLQNMKPVEDMPIN